MALKGGLKKSKANLGQNRNNGKFWEQIFFKRAQMNGLFPLQNYLTARYIFKNNYKVVKSNLDMTLISPKGEVGFFDCKSFDGEYFTFSNLNPDQVKRAVLYNTWQVPSGFVVLFRPINRISFFTGLQIHQAGPGSRFVPLDGLELGRLESFDLRALFKK